MIPVAFDYLRPSTVDDAVAALAEAGDEAKVLAGGQSLLPVLRLRLAAPSLVVDLSGMPQLTGVRDDGDALVIGAMTTHDTVATDPLVAQYAPLLAKAAGKIGDRQVRHLGTIGGSLAHADPAGDLPAVTVALDAEYVVNGPSGRRTVRAAEFGTDYFSTSLGDSDVLVEVRLPKLGGWAGHYEKFHRVSQSWALVGVAVAVQRDNGSIAQARIALTNMGPAPRRMSNVESALAGVPVSDQAAIASACASVTDGLTPPDDLNASADYRLHLARVLTARAVAAACS
jgi:carbon-monoxide dehydrogenase medium subunit